MTPSEPPTAETSTAPETSARTSDRPMAVTRAEVVHGGFVAWLAFVALLEITLVAAFLVATVVTPHSDFSSLGFLPAALLYGAVFGGGVSLVVELIGLPVAWLVARGMAGVRSIRAHVAVYAAFGAGVGLAVTGVFAFLSGRASIWWSPFPPLAVALSAASVVFGWWRASRAARWALAART